METRIPFFIQYKVKVLTAMCIFHVYIGIIVVWFKRTMWKSRRVVSRSLSTLNILKRILSSDNNAADSQADFIQQGFASQKRKYRISNNCILGALACSAELNSNETLENAPTSWGGRKIGSAISLQQGGQLFLRVGRLCEPVAFDIPMMFEIASPCRFAPWLIRKSEGTKKSSKSFILHLKVTSYYF